MLCLTRRKQTSIQIGPDITVTILKIKGSEIQVGIQAPKHVPITRGELLDRGERKAA